jgi:hypothetical protein
MLGYQKIEFLWQQAAQDGYEFAWIDTCCIDKRSSAELSEAIKSMFEWYRKSEVCYALLTDIEHNSFLDSRWWTRAWTLQELVAPTNVIFFNAQGTIGTKVDLASLIEAFTGIAHETLINPDSLFDRSVAQRMCWASKRIATRSEDIAYSFLGIFQINMPLLRTLAIFNHVIYTLELSN